MKRILLIAFLPEASFTSRFSLSTSVYRFLRHLFFPGNIFYIQRILTPFFYMCSFTHFSVSHSLFCSFPSSSCSPGYFTFSLAYSQKSSEHWGYHCLLRALEVWLWHSTISIRKTRSSLVL